MAHLFLPSRQFAGANALLRFRALLVLLLGLLASPAARALQGFDNCADPSTIVKEGNKYWIFTTGADVYAMYSTDLINWQPGAKSVFNGVQPAWITSRVTNFDRAKDAYWAPECVYRNGKYYLYYSCSKWGYNTSAIGLATNTTLDPASPNFKWVDQGEVVSTSGSSPENAIDPAIITDASGKLWMSYGSFFKGIKLVQLDPATGKRLNTSSYWLAGNVGSDGTTRNDSGSEASYIVRNGNYYYLFLNKGACCHAANSTYYIVVGRSSSITGPYLDKNGKDLNKDGGTTLLGTQGNYVGPGCVGLFIENGVNYLTHHYYDKNQLDSDGNPGRPRLSVGNLGWDGAAWPFITRDWLATGRYTLTNQSSKLVWDAWGCTGASGQAIAQGTAAGRTCQQWDLTPTGNGEYKITNALGGLSADVINNNPANGAKLQLYAANTSAGQRFKIERTNVNTFVLSSVNGNRVVEVPACSATAGTQLALYDYLGNTCQQWGIAPTAAARLAAASQPAAAALPANQLSVYPNPAEQGHFVVSLSTELAAGPVTLTLADDLGRRVYSRTSAGQATLPVETELRAGLYLLQVSGAAGTFTEKIIIR